MGKALFLSFILWVTPMVKTNTNSYSLTIKVNELQNSKGNIIIALYNKEGSIPDENFQRFYKKEFVNIIENKATYTFENLPLGFYAVTILHDENNNGKIDKKMMLPMPKEGVGFSNYDDFGLNNRPNFKNAGFNLTKNTTIAVKVIYM